jgi:GDPmannose 4,6-dehydratase
MADRTAFITGITGQDGSYLAELLLEKGYRVHGMVRRTALEAPDQRLRRIRHLLDRIELHTGSLDGFASLFKLVNKIRPDECYHLAASSFVSYSFDDEFATLHSDVGSTHYLLSAIHDCAPACRFYFAATSEMFGTARETPQNETSAYRLHASSGILYNHESPRRSPEFVSQKIATGAARIRAGFDGKVQLGNLDGRRDWGHAVDYVRAMWLMLQQEEPSDFVIATGVTHSVREFCQAVFARMGLDWQEHVTSDGRLFRESEAIELRGDASRARKILGWEPAHDFETLVNDMADAALGEPAVA